MLDQNKQEMPQVKICAYQRKGTEGVEANLVFAKPAEDGTFAIRIDTGGDYYKAKGHDVRLWIPIEVMLDALPEMIKLRLKDQMNQSTIASNRTAINLNRLTHENAHLKGQLATATEERKKQDQELKTLRDQVKAFETLKNAFAKVES